MQPLRERNWSLAHKQTSSDPFFSLEVAPGAQAHTASLDFVAAVLAYVDEPVLQMVTGDEHCVAV